LLNNAPISRVTNCVYLGINIDEKLKWNIHINSVYNTLIKYTSIFYKLRFILPPCVLKNLYFALVHSRLLYGIEVYGNVDLCLLDKLIKLNNRILRTLLSKPLDCPLIDLYSAYNTLPIPALFQYKILNFMFLYKHHTATLPPAFHTYFQTNSSIHQYNTRNRNNFHLFSYTNNYGSKTIFNIGSKLWNDLPDTFKTISSSSIFLKSLKIHLRNMFFKK